MLSKLFSSSSPSPPLLLSFSPPLLVALTIPDLNSKRQIAVGTAGPQQPAPDRSGHHQTSTTSSGRCWTSAEPQPPAPDHSGHCWTSTASSRSQWALPDLNGQIQIRVGTAGPGQIRSEFMPHRMSNVRMYARLSARVFVE